MDKAKQQQERLAADGQEINKVADAIIDYAAKQTVATIDVLTAKEDKEREIIVSIERRLALYDAVLRAATEVKHY